jgi:hypothetical protein
MMMLSIHLKMLEILKYDDTLRQWPVSNRVSYDEAYSLYTCATAALTQITSLCA